MSLSITVPKIITTFGKQLISSKDAGYKLARLGIGASVAGAGIGVGVGTGLNLASDGISKAGDTTSKGFGIDKGILFLIGAVIVVLIIIGGKKR